MPRGRKSAEGNSSYSYFRQMFLNNPELLDNKSNEAILNRYRADHDLPEDAEIEKKVKGNLANLKSVMRKRGREESKAKRAADKANGVTAVAPRKGHRLEALEEQIDDCLTLAKSQDREELKDIISLLRHARNKVVWKMGQ